MLFYSTGGRSKPVTFRDAVMQGLAPDGGLFMPESIPRLPARFFQRDGRSFQETSLEVLGAIAGDELPAQILREIVDDAFGFDAPVVQLTDGLYVLELFHGPTLAFKDFGARFMARLMSHFLSKQDEELTILVATSGDTGSAVAHGFYGVKGVRVIVLYPEGRVSEIQEKQMATLGGNITAIEVRGNFDDCQRLVKMAFLDREVTEKLHLTSANSINIARLIPQSFYYFHAWMQLPDNDIPMAFSVPSGNYGNLTAGLMAGQMGLPVSRFIAATNKNRVVPEYLETGTFSPRSSQDTISNAMDVGNPSNFARMLSLYPEFAKMQEVIVGSSFTDEETRDAIVSAYRSFGYVLDPHGAVAFLGAESYRRQNKDARVIFLETAHPAKFPDVVEQAIGRKVQIPERLRACMDREKRSIGISAEFEDLRSFLLSL